MNRFSRMSVVVFSLSLLLSVGPVLGMQKDVFGSGLRPGSAPVTPAGSPAKVAKESPSTLPFRAPAVEMQPMGASAGVASASRDAGTSVAPEGCWARLKGWTGAKCGAVKSYFKSMSQGKKELIAAAVASVFTVSINASQLIPGNTNTTFANAVSIALPREIAVMLRRQNLAARLLVGAALAIPDAVLEYYLGLYQVGTTGLTALPGLIYELQTLVEQYKMRSNLTSLVEHFKLLPPATQRGFVAVCVAYEHGKKTLALDVDDVKKVAFFCAGRFKKFTLLSEESQTEFVDLARTAIGLIQVDYLKAAVLENLVNSEC